MPKHDPWDDEEDQDPTVFLRLPYTPVPISVTEAYKSGKISPAALGLWTILAGYVFDKENEKGWKVWPSKERLAKQAGCTERHILNLVGDLENANLLRVVRRPMKSSIYDLNPAWDQGRTIDG